MPSFPRRRTTTTTTTTNNNNNSGPLIPDRADEDNTFLARLAREEARDDWRNKPRHEKIRLAKIELRRRRSERSGVLRASSWRWELVLIVALAFTGALVLLLLLRHRASVRRRTGHGETWLETVEDVLGMS